MEPSFWSWEKIAALNALPTLREGRNGAQLLELGKAADSPATHQGQGSRNGAQLLELGKEGADEWPQCGIHGLSQWSPAFGAGKRGSARDVVVLIDHGRNGAQLLELGKESSPFDIFTGANLSQWSPAFGAGKSHRRHPHPAPHRPVAMEPSFWSWEKRCDRPTVPPASPSRNGAQLLELGKASPRRYAPGAGSVAMEPSFWSWEKNTDMQGAFDLAAVAMEPSFWSWEKPSGLGTTG